jgi:hypothetical protein
MRYIKLTEDQFMHLKTVLREDKKRRLKSIRDAGSANYISDDQVAERILKFNRSDRILEMLNENSTQVDDPNAEVAEAMRDDDDLFRVD